LAEAGWRIERRGVPTHGSYHFEVVEPMVVLRQRQQRSSLKRR
jgi:hypothetical protein